MPILLSSSKGSCMFIVAGSSLCEHTCALHATQCTNTHTHTSIQRAKNISQSCFQATNTAMTVKGSYFDLTVSTISIRMKLSDQHADRRLTCSSGNCSISSIHISTDVYLFRSSCQIHWSASLSGSGVLN